MGVSHSLMVALLATAENKPPYFLSRSRIKYLGALPHGVASLSCWAVQASVGFLVTAAWTIRRVFNSMMMKMYSDQNNRSWTTVKSQAQMTLA
jgi:hypothetical protein